MKLGLVVSKRSIQRYLATNNRLQLVQIELGWLVADNAQRALRLWPE